MSNSSRSLTALILIAILGARLDGQAPPPELRFDVLTDVGPVPAPATCGCVTRPFTVLRMRPGWGYGTGPATLETDTPPLAADRERQHEVDQDTLRSLDMNINDGLAGNSASSFGLGLELTIGAPLKRNDVEAAKWFLLSATAGHPDAAVQLGHRYHRGLGLEQNDEAAAYWFYRAAKGGAPLGMIALGSLYAAGRGVPQDWRLAVSWWREGKHHRFLGDAYACGLGVTQNTERAIREYEQGADQDDMGSVIQLGHMHAGKCAAAADDELAFTWYEKAAQRGYPEAQVALADLMLQNRADGGPLVALMWARLAELRLPNGELRTLAARHAAAAVRHLSPAQVAHTEAMVKSMIAMSTNPRER